MRMRASSAKRSRPRARARARARRAILPSVRLALAAPFLVHLALTAACTSGTAADPSGSTATLELGTGETTFAPITDGAALPLVHGCQGGYHVWIALRARGFDSRGLVVRLRLERAGDGVLLSEPFSLRVAFAEEGGAASIAGLPLPVISPEDVAGTTLRLVASVQDDERSATSTCTLTVFPGPDLCAPDAGSDASP